MTVDTGEHPPVNKYPYRTPHRWKDKIRKEIQDLHSLKIIRPSRSPWASPILPVSKPDGSVRMCVDFRALNAITTPDVYPLPRIDALIEEVATSRYVITMDLSKGYYQIAIAPDDQEKTAFISEWGKFEFVTMPFGLKNAPSCFQRLMDRLLGHLPFASAYIDDVVIYSNTWDEHLDHLEEVLHILQEAGLTIKLRKCIFAARTVQFLGHTIGNGTIRPQDTKCQAIARFPRPTKKKELRAFLGLAGYYRRFVRNFAQRSTSLTDLTSRKLPDQLQWTKRHEMEFQDLKQALAHAPLLSAPQPHLPYRLDTDASDCGIGAVLSQNVRDHDTPVAYFSRKLLPRERNYTITEKECLAVVAAVKHFAVYLLGAEFAIVTDHGALTSLQQMTGGGPRVTRWALALQPFSYTIHHRNGKDHLNADALSRMPVEEDSSLLCSPERLPEGGEMLDKPNLPPLLNQN